MRNCVSLALHLANSLSTIGPVISRSVASGARVKVSTRRGGSTRPFYTHTNPQPLTPGEIYAFAIEVLPISYVFKQGHRIRLELANGDSPATDGVFAHPYHPSLMGTDTIYHDGARASCLLLPVIPSG
jgi:predicted acyl esterase